MTKIIDAHVHIDRFKEKPGPDFDFFHPPMAEIVVDEIVRHMDEEGVEKAVILQHPNGAMNDEVSNALTQYPDRFKGAMILEFDDERCLAQMEENYKKGLTVIKLEMFGTTMYYPDIKLDSKLLQKVYAKAQKLGIVIAIDPFRIGMSGYQPEALHRMIPAYPNLKFVICHMGFPFANSHTEPGKKEVYKRMLALAEYDNVWFDATAMPDMYAGIEVYPYPSALQLIRDFIDTYGVNKVLFGSDLPEELNQEDYHHLIAMFKDSALFSEHEKACILYENANSVYFAS